MQPIQLGDFELSLFSDGTYPLDGGAFFGVVPKVMWSKKATADDRNFVAAGLNSLLVRTGEHTVLVETGIGNKLPERMIRIYGQPAKLLDNLAAGGVSPEDIDVVINTHLHFDHCGWNTVRNHGRAVATFPRAKYYVQEGEWLHGRGFEHSRFGQLHQRQLRSAHPKRANATAAGWAGDCAGNFGEGFSGAYLQHASGVGGERRQDRLLHLGLDSDGGPYRSHLGDGV